MTLASPQYAGNVGYDDAADRYVFDSFVANSRRVQAGDLAVLRDETTAFAVAKVEQLDEQNGLKLQRRCPECRTTGIKERTRTSPRFRCNGGHTFDAPVEERAECRLYQARFGDSRRTLAHHVPVSALRRLILRYSEQHAMQELNRFGMIGPEFTALADALNVLDSSPTYPKGDDANEAAAPYVPTGVDTRIATMQNVRARRGQPMFRFALRQRYGDRCQVSGCTLLELLEAAHISPYRSEDDQHPENGLLLRADLHTLFDLDLMGIHPESLKIHFNPMVTSDSSYLPFVGAQLACAMGRPSRLALESKWALFQSRIQSTVT